MAKPKVKVVGRDIVHRWEENPLIIPEHLSFRCSDICNAGAVKIGDEYLLLVTIQSLEGFHSIYLARSADGYNFKVADEPFLSPSQEPSFAEYDERGVLDARIVCLEGQYYIVYDAFGPTGYRLALARTRDFTSVEHLGLISEPDTKAGALLPRKIKGKYTRLGRPWSGGSIWISYSDDLVYWGGAEVVITPRAGFWDSDRVGAATPPLEIERGWLLIYYGIKETSAGPLFRLGAVILDRDDPARVVGRTNVPILTPREEYERIGDVPNLVFSCGAIIEADDEVKLYYGASNSCICLGTTKVPYILQACVESDKEF